MAFNVDGRALRVHVFFHAHLHFVLLVLFPTTLSVK